MRAYGLGFISDKDLYEHVSNTVAQYRLAINFDEFNQNIIDPIKLTFDHKVYKRSIENVINDEIIRQLDKSNNNRISYFHQNIFKYISADWQIPSSGFDLINPSRHIFCEIKNKHNTMNSASSQKTYLNMQSKLLDDDQATCYLVEIISKKSQDIAWGISLNGIHKEHGKIRRISMDKFYQLITADKLAFKKLCDALPLVLDDIVMNKDLIDENTVLAELKALSPDILKNLYKLAFSSYEGF